MRSIEMFPKETGQTRQGQAREGQAREGQARRGEARRGVARRGEARRGEIDAIIMLFNCITPIKESADQMHSYLLIMK